MEAVARLVRSLKSARSYELPEGILITIWLNR